jgi:hypothetical protein
MRAVRLGCDSWCCPVCSGWLQWRWGRHLADCLLCHEGALYAGTIDPTRWGSLSRRLRERKAHHIYLRNDALVIATDPFPSASPIVAVEAVSALGSALRALSSPEAANGKHPVSTSRGWKLPTGESGAWKRVAWLQVKDPEPILHLLTQHGIEAQAGQVGSKGEWVVRWQWPADWPEDRRRGVWHGIPHPGQ